MPAPTRILSTDELTAVFDDHREAIYLGQWKELTVGNLRLVRRDDDVIEIEELAEDWGAL
jgi:hypothetical protein